jgi:hypothetical protein
MDQRAQNGSPNKLPAAALRIGICVSEPRMTMHTWNGSIARYKNNASTGFLDGSQLGTEKFLTT